MLVGVSTRCGLEARWVRHAFCGVVSCEAFDQREFLTEVGRRHEVMSLPLK